MAARRFSPRRHRRVWLRGRQGLLLSGRRLSFQADLRPHLSQRYQAGSRRLPQVLDQDRALQVHTVGTKTILAARYQPTRNEPWTNQEHWHLQTEGRPRDALKAECHGTSALVLA